MQAVRNARSNAANGGQSSRVSRAPQPPSGAAPSNATTDRAPQPTIPDATVKLEYAKQHNVHHLFELLAHRVLDRRPEDLYAFLRTQIEDIEATEKRKGTYDPTEVRHGTHTATSRTTPPPPAGSNGVTSSSSAAAAAGSRGTTLPTRNKKKSITLGVFGLDNAGKTSLIGCMGGETIKNPTPTVGFTPTDLETEDHDVRIFDLGGAETFRGVWPHYFHDCHGLVFVVDATDRKRLAEAARVFKEVVGHEYVRSKPIVVCANKRDLASDADITHVTGPAGLDVANALGKNTEVRIAACCAIDVEDKGVADAADWLVVTVTEQYEFLAALVAEHTAAVKAARKAKLEEQRRRVEAQKAQEEAQERK